MTSVVESVNIEHESLKLVRRTRYLEQQSQDPPGWLPAHWQPSPQLQSGIFEVVLRVMN